MELVINTYGVSISRDNEGFVISNADGRQRVPVVGIDSIQIGKGAQITSDAVMLAVEHEIEVFLQTDPANRWLGFGALNTGQSPPYAKGS